MRPGNVLVAAAALGLPVLLAAPTPAERNAALASKVRQKDPTLSEALLAALNDPDTGVRQIAIANLDRAAGDPRLIPALRRRLEQEGLDTRWLVIRTIAQIPAALAAFSENATAWARDPDPLVRRAFLAHIQPGSGVAAVVTPLLEEALRSRDPTSRMSAADSLKRLGRTVDLSRVFRDAASPDEVVAGAASYAAWVLWDEAAERAARAALRSPDLLWRARAADLLRKRNLPFDPGLLGPVFRDGSEAAQLAAAGSLSRVQTAKCVAPLRAALDSRFPSVRQAVVYALEVVPAPESIDTLTGALRHGDANVRYRAAVVLGRLRARPAVTALRAASAGDVDLRVRDAASIAAGLAAGGDVAAVLSSPEPRPAGRRAHTFAGKPVVVRDGVIHLAGRKQLFADDWLLESREGAKRVVHRFRKDPRNPVLEQQYPWELQGVTNYCTPVEYDTASGLFRVWYLSYWRIPGFVSNRFGTTEKNRAQLMAVSADGIRWARPNFDQIAFEGSRANNLIGAADNLVRLPEGRYASYAPMRRDGRFYLSVSYSPDGVSGWTEPEPVMESGGDVGTLTRDDLGDGLLGFTKWRVGWWLGPSFPEKYDYATRALLKVRSTGFRSFAPVWGRDARSLSRGPVNVLPGPEDDREAAVRVARAFASLDFFESGGFHTEVYQVVPFPYEGLYFAFPIVFTPSGRGGANDDGVVGLSLVVSRDPLGREGWQRPGGKGLECVLEHGRWGEWDSTQLYGPSNLLVVNDEIVLYYNASSHGHEPFGAKSDSTGNPAYRSAIGRAAMRLDGMVSLRAGAREASILTRVVQFDGDELRVNVAGELRVEVVDRTGRVVARSHTVRADGVREPVRWAFGDTLAGRTGRLRFLLRNGDLYAFQIGRSAR